MSFQYSLKCCDIVSPSYIVWKLIPDRGPAMEKALLRNLHGVPRNLRNRANEAAHGEAEMMLGRVYR